MKNIAALRFGFKSWSTATLLLILSCQTTAQSQVPVPNLDLLDSYPTLKFLAALITFAFVIIGGLAWLKGEKLGKTEASQTLASPRSPDAAVQLFFDGPLRAIFDDLQVLKSAQQVNKLENKDEMARLISLAKHEVLNKLVVVQGEIIRELNEAHAQNLTALNNLVREFGELQETVIRLDEFMRRGRRA